MGHGNWVKINWSKISIFKYLKSAYRAMCKVIFGLEYPLLDLLLCIPKMPMSKVKLALYYLIINSTFKKFKWRILQKWNVVDSKVKIIITMPLSHKDLSMSSMIWCEVLKRHEWEEKLTGTSW
jgi:hypothetical protein